MGNREIYKFDYFTIDNYRRIVELAVKQEFSFILHKDDFVVTRKDIIWRHDVEFSPSIALDMARIEASYGVKATYFFQIHSAYYNIYERYFSDILLEIKSLGHHIGLHFDSHYYNIQTEEELSKYLNLDKSYFEGVFGIKIDTFSFHNTNQFILSCEKYKYGELINVYSSFFKENYSYCADSTGYWRYEILDEVLRDDKVQHLQVLIHDAMWSKKILSPRNRVLQSIQDNVNRIVDSYDKFFLTSSAKNIDD